MKLAGLLGLLQLLCSLSVIARSQVGTVQVHFYSEDISFQFSEEMLLDLPTLPKEKDMIAFFKGLEKTNYTLLLNELQQKKQDLALNDWLFFDLMKKTVKAIRGKGQQAEVELSCWFLLTKSGFDTRLTYLKNKQFVYVYTQDEVFEVPMISENKRNFANLSSIHRKEKSNGALYMLNFIPNPKGKAFSFYLDQLPLLKPDTEPKNLSFSYRGETYAVNVEVDKTSIEVMRTYPFIDEEQYLLVPFSQSIARSLLPNLQKWTKDLSKIETLELLVAFTRSSFKYKEDKEYFGFSKPMIADEVFHYPYSDCEDRSALFFCLVRETVDLPMIIVAFSDHLTIAVALEEEIGDAIRYQGKDYYICDPTGPANSTVIGKFPTGYQNKKFKIIGQYK